MTRRSWSGDALNSVRDYIERHRRTVFNPLEQRLYGLVHIAQGIVMVMVGKYGPSWTLRYSMWGSRKYHRKAMDD